MNKKGFTLIELLVVVAIIGMLSSVVLVAMGPARKSSKDARRQADIRQINTAQELCYGDASCGGASSYDTTPTGGIGTYLPILPLDPTNSTPYVYTWVTNQAQAYCVYARLEAPATTTYFCASNNGVNSSTTVPTSGSGNCCGL